MAVAPPRLPPQVHAKLAPRHYLNAFLSHDSHCRPSGRRPDTARTPRIHRGALSHAHGSSLVRIGDTAVVCGIRGHILRAEDVPDHGLLLKETDNLSSRADSNDPLAAKIKRKQDGRRMARLGLLVPNIELASGCSPLYLPGGPPSQAAQSLTQRLLSLCYTSELVDLDDLSLSYTADSNNSLQKERIEDGRKVEVKAYWSLSISIIFLSLDHGPSGALDAVWLGLSSALQDIRLPKAYWNEEFQDVQYAIGQNDSFKLSLNQGRPIPSCMTFGIWPQRHESSILPGHQEQFEILSDPDAFEEDLCQELVTIAFGAQGEILTIEKAGGAGLVNSEHLKDIFMRAKSHKDDHQLVSNVAL